MSKPQNPDVDDLTHQCGARGLNPVGVLRLTQGGIVLSADTSASDILCNLKQFSPLGKPLGDLLDWQDKPQIAAALDLARKGTGGQLVLGAVRPDAPLQRLDLTLLPLGAEGDILCSLRLLCDPVPAVLAMSADDIRSQAATVLETISKGIQVLGRDGTLLYQNVAAETMLGVSAQALGTAQAHDILHHRHADGSPYPLHDCPIYKTLTDGQPRFVVDEVFFRADGSAFPVEYSALPVPDAAAPSNIGVIVSFRDITERKLEDTLRDHETEIVDLLTLPETRAQGLDLVTRTVDRMLPAFRSAVMCLGTDGTLHTASAPNLPEAFVQAMDGIPVREGAASCGTAAFRKQMVIVRNIETDPFWENRRQLATDHGLHTCFSTPIIGIQGEVLGTFALYADQISQASVQITTIMSRMAMFLRNVLERSLQARALRESEARYEEIFNLVPVSIWVYDASGELALLREVQAHGVTDMAAFLDANPDFVMQAVARHKVTQVNARALAFYGAKSLEELTEAFKAVVGSPDFQRAYRNYLLALASGQPHFTVTGTMYRRDGSAFTMLTEMHLPQGDSARVLMAELDITDQQIAERRFRTVVQTSSSAIFDHDLRTDTFWWSEGMRSTFGHAPEDLTSGTKKWVDLVHPDDLAGALVSVTKAHTPPYDVATASYRLRRANGAYAYVEVRARVLLDSMGQPERTIGSLVDVTDRVMAEERFRIVAENTSDVVFENNWATERMWWSDGFRTVFGHDPKTAAHTLSAFLGLVHPDDQIALWDSITDWRTRPDTRLSTEFRLRRADGSYADVEVRARMAFDTGNNVGRVVGALLDITQRKATEERLQTAVQVTSDVVWDQDLKADRIWWSDSMSDKLGIDRAALSADPEVWHRTIHPDDLKKARESFRAAVNGTADTWSHEYRLRRSDGRYILIRDTARILRDRSGQAYRAVGAIVDLTQTRQLEEQVQRSQRLETIGQLTGGIAHDFNNLLAIVMGSADLLLDRLPPEGEDHDLANMVLAAAERGAALTERLLAFARKRTLSPKLTAPSEIILALKPILQRTLGPQIDVTLDLDAPPLALVDVAQFENALINLCVNARDAMPRGGKLTISAKPVSLSDSDRALFPELATDTCLLVTVTDTGEGMSAETLSHVFEPFFTTKGVGKGTGLGLPTVHGFVRQSGGAIRISSELGKGTTVQLYFPASATMARPARPKPRAAQQRTEQAKPLKAHVLVVEDDDMLRAQTRQSLTLLGCRVTETASAAQALDLLRTTAGIDLVLTDIVMPGGMDGRQLAARIRTLYPALPVLLTTGYSKGLIDDPALPAVLFKPYRLNDLKQRLLQILQP